jgi:hypothetical protein
MPKWLKLLIGILLLPLCIGAAKALVRVVSATGSADTIWVALAGGAASWWAIYLMLPKPMRLYVFGHELTHALWTWLFGGSVRKFKVTSRGGHVVVTKSNFIIALAPYFFPLYAMAVVGVFCLGHWLWDWAAYFVWFHLLLGAAYAFHLTLTWHILQIEQTDITSQGYLFSAAVIFLGNIGFLLLGIPLLTERVTVLTSMSWWLHETRSLVQWLESGL